MRVRATGARTANERRGGTRRDPAEINQRILRSFLPPSPPSPFPLARLLPHGGSSYSRMHYGEAEGRHKTIRAVIPAREALCVLRARARLLYVPRSATRDREPIQRIPEGAKWLLLINEY